MSTDAGEATLAMLAAFNARDEAAFLARFDESIVFVPLLTSTGLDQPAYRGLEGMRRYWRDVAAWADGRIHAASVRNHGPFAITRATVVATPHGEHERSVAVTYVVHARDGRICELTTLADAGGARSSFGLEPGDGQDAFALRLPAVGHSVGAA
ncbi:MAG: hypothetical protein JWM31_2570, partial [Solirubrobacterales bacterium]|nr:hypothetical protein [Solirubrobacterales bacterium]